MATPADQHDTLALTHLAPAAVPPSATATFPAASAWSQVPPFLTPVPAPLMVMRNNAAVVGATLGSVSLFLSLIPLIGIVAWVLAPIGLLTSAIGLVVGMSRQAGRVGAVFGLLASGAALAICFAWLVLLLAL